MRRSKLGDLYAIKVPNGYKLFQRAYDIPRSGNFIRVFTGLYDSIPDNLEDIVAGPHSYIINFHSSRAYRIGLAQLCGNFPIPEEYPYPEYMFRFWRHCDSGKYHVQVLRTDLREIHKFSVSRMNELPDPFKQLTLLGEGLSPEWVLYLFDTDWSPSDLSNYTPGCSEQEYEAVLHPYAVIVNGCLERDAINRTQGT